MVSSTCRTAAVPPYRHLSQSRCTGVNASKVLLLVEPEALY